MHNKSLSQKNAHCLGTVYANFLPVAVKAQTGWRSIRNTYFMPLLWRFWAKPSARIKWGLNNLNKDKLKSVSSEDSSPISINTENSHLLSRSTGAEQSAIRPGNPVRLLAYLLEDLIDKPTNRVIQITDQNWIPFLCNQSPFFWLGLVSFMPSGS